MVAADGWRRRRAQPIGRAHNGVTEWLRLVQCRLYRNRQGLTQDRLGHKPQSDPAPRSRPQLALERIQLFASWLPQRQILVSGDSAYGGQSVLRHLPANVGLISHVHPKGGLYAPLPALGRRGPGARRGRACPAWPPGRPITVSMGAVLTFDQFGLHATLHVKAMQVLYCQAGQGHLRSAERP
jgi:hypothetical protein